MINEPAQPIESKQDSEASASLEKFEPTGAPARIGDAVGLDMEVDQEQQPFRFLTDHNVPVSVGNALIAMGHDVVRERLIKRFGCADLAA